MPEYDYQNRFKRMLESAERFEEEWRRGNQDHFRYYDGDQWTDQERESIAARGQPAVTMNIVGPFIDMVRAMEIQQRVNIQVVGREESDDSMATLLTALLKQVFDRVKLDYFVSKAFKDALVGGRGWLECGVRADSRGKDQIYVDYVPWQQVYVDPCSIRPDASDARFIVRVKWLDRDVVEKLFPGAAEMLDERWEEDTSFKGQEYEAQRTAPDRGIGKYYDFRSRRVKICQCWYTMPTRKSVEVVDEETGRKAQKDVFWQKVHHVIFCDDIILEGSAMDDSRNGNSVDVDIFPLVPMLCETDHKGHPVGMVKNMLTLQDEINKLNSKMIHKFGTRQVTVESSACRDPEEIQLQAQRPDGLIVLNDGGLGKIRVDYNTSDMGYITNYMQMVFQMMQRETGINDSTLGLGGTNERSGVIQSARIAQGASLHTSKLDNLFYCRERIAYVVLRLIGAYYTDYRVLRVTQPNGVTEDFAFNQVERGEDGKPVRILHKIEDTLDYDVVMKRVQPFTSIRDRQLTILSEVLKTGVLPPEIACEMLLELSDIPNKEDILRRTQAFAQQQQDMAMKQQATALAQQQQDLAAAQEGAPM